jgi:hypothetical protein
MSRSTWLMREPEIRMTPNESKRLARQTGIASIVLAVACFAIVLATWRPFVAVYGASHPWGITCLELGIWFAIAAWLCFVPPFHGILLVVGGLGALLLLWNANSAASSQQAPWPIALGALAFTAGGLLVMLTSKISTEKHFRRPYWHEAWPGAVLALAGLVGAAILLVVLPVPPLRLPAGVIPAEAAP